MQEPVTESIGTWVTVSSSIRSSQYVLCWRCVVKITCCRVPESQYSRCSRQRQAYFEMPTHTNMYLSLMFICLKYNVQPLITVNFDVHSGCGRYKVTELFPANSYRFRIRAYYPKKYNNAGFLIQGVESGWASKCATNQSI